MNREMEARPAVWAAVIEYYGSDYSQWAIRWLTEDQEDAKIGDVLRPSYEWDIENDVSCHATTGEMLPGTCGVELIEGTLDEIEEAISTAPYCGKIALIAGDFAGYGNDPKEVYLENARVMGL